MAQKLQQQLRELGSKLENPPASKDALIKLLKQVATCLSDLDQSPSPAIMELLQPSLNAIAKPELLKHQDRDVKVLVATCVCEITRITAPEAPYSDDVLRDIFQLIVGTFGGLDDINSPLFGRRVVILETLARYRSCVVMLDLECDDLVNEMFHTFLTVASDDHPESVLTSMKTIMSLLLDESEDIEENMLLTLLLVLGRGKSDVSMAARRLAMNVIEHCAGKLEPCIKQFLISSMSGDDSSLNSQFDYHETDQLDVRLRAVKLLGDLFALPDRSIPEIFRPLFSEFLKRLTDRVVEVRISVIENIKNCLLSNPSREEAPEITKLSQHLPAALIDRLLDYDENVRKHVVAALFDVVCQSLKSVPAETVKLVAERLRDKSLIVKRYTMERLAELYRLYCTKYSAGSVSADEFDWIPGRILRSLYDRDFRFETIESILCGSLHPSEFSVKDKVKHWIAVFSAFEKVDIKALEKLLAQKQRLQQEMQKYLSLRQTYQEGDAPELQKRILVYFRAMSRLFGDPAKAEEGFRLLNQLKDGNIWKILTSLLDPDTSFEQAYTYRDELLKILGETHPLYDFLDTLSTKCSYLLFNKDYVKVILSEVLAHKTTGNTKLILSCMNLLVILSSFSPLFLTGSEEDLISLLKEDDEMIKEGVVHVLARAGGTIREQLSKTSSSVDLLLERLCLEGSRKQAKYSVQALAAITKDDGLKSLSVLYKKLVDILESKTHLPAVLQSLGCIAQTAMPEAEDDAKTSWDEQSELCLLKVFGIKTLVKSYLPLKDSHLRPGIENLLGILKNILSFGEISKDIKSSPVDKAQLRLASAKGVLRLSKLWDQKIPIDVFYLTLRISQDTYQQARKAFLNKLHQYIKEKLVDAKYACAILLNISGCPPHEFEEDKHNLMEVVQMFQQLKARQLSIQRDTQGSEAVTNRPLGGQSGIMSNKGMDTLSTVLSIFHSIKCSEDAVDQTKSKNSHAFCDLGLAITKRMVHQDVDFKVLTASVPLPPTLYNPLEKKEGDDSERRWERIGGNLGKGEGKGLRDTLVKELLGCFAGFHGTFLEHCIYLAVDVIAGNFLYVLDHLIGVQFLQASGGESWSWLVDDKALAHFESLKVENTDAVPADAGKDEKGLEDSDIDGAELPLGKMMKQLKSQRIKKRKKVGKQSLPSEKNNTENDMDILGMVREINLENNERASTMENSKSGSNQKHFATKERIDQNGKKISESQKKKKKKTGDIFSTPVPTRKRSPFGKDTRRQSHSKNSVKSIEKTSQTSSKNTEISPLRSIKVDGDLFSWSEVKLPKEKSMVEPNEPDSSHSPTDKSLTRCKSKDTQQYPDDISHSENNHEFKDYADEKTLIGHSKGGSVGTNRKRKRRSIARLAKILYDDGDVEVLQLEKEKWEVVNDDLKPQKRLKSSPSPSKGMSSKQKKTETHDVSRQTKSPTKNSEQAVCLAPRFRRKTTPKQNGENSHQSESNTVAGSSDDEKRTTVDVSDSHPHASSEADEVHSDDSVKGHASPQKAIEEEVEDDHKEPDTEPKSDSSDGEAIGDSDDEPLYVEATYVEDRLALLEQIAGSKIVLVDPGAIIPTHGPWSRRKSKLERLNAGVGFWCC
ncbi:hypothetical protein ACLOJK_041708 [Asimina triloba]